MKSRSLRITVFTLALSLMLGMTGIVPVRATTAADETVTATAPAETISATEAPETPAEPEEVPAETEPEVQEAKDISTGNLVTDKKYIKSLVGLFNDTHSTGGWTTDAGAYMTIEYANGLGAIYTIFDASYKPYTVTNNDTGVTKTVNEYGFINHCVNLVDLFGTAPTSVTVAFPEEKTVIMKEVYVFTPGRLPDFVQQWEPPAEGKADLCLFSTHGDDEQLFFAGVLPYYAGELGYNVQVIYFTDHHNQNVARVHEMLNGLWAVGVRHYPVFGEHDDFFSQNQMAQAYSIYESRGWTREEMLGWVVENLRRFKPMVAVGHDLEGEYGHSMHMIYADLLTEAVSISADASYYSESADTYGVWDTPKTYLHLYEENEIIMDWDQPLEKWDGMTAFEVTRDIGYPCHVSQYQDFAWYHVAFDKAIDCPKYNPCYYGLYRTTVGLDVEKKDFFENVITHAEQDLIDEQARLEEERLEAERLAAEQAAAEEQARLDEEARLEAERLAAEEAERIAQEEEAARLEEEARLAQEAAEEQVKLITVICVFLFLVAMLVLLVVLRKKMRN